MSFLKFRIPVLKKFSELSIPLKTDYLVCLIPIASIAGDWIVASVIVFSVFLLVFISKLTSIDELRIYNPVWWSLLLAWGLFVAVRSPFFSDGIKYYLGTIFIPVLIFILITNIELNKKIINYICYSYMISGVVLGLNSLIIFADSGFNTKLRIPSLWADYNIYAGYLIIILCISISFIINKQKNDSLVLPIIASVFSLIGIFLTQSRGAWLAIVFTFSIFFLKRPKIILPIGILVGVIFFLYSDVIIDRYLSVINFTKDGSTLGRLQAWYSSILMIKNNLLMGYGFESYIFLRDQYLSVYIVAVLHSHNTFLRTLLEMGLVGFILYFNFFVRGFIYSFRIPEDKDYKKYVDALRLSFVCLAVTFMFEPFFSLYGVSTITIWVLISLSYLFYKNKNESDIKTAC